MRLCHVIFFPNDIFTQTVFQDLGNFSLPCEELTVSWGFFYKKLTAQEIHLTVYCPDELVKPLRLGFLSVQTDQSSVMGQWSRRRIWGKKLLSIPLPFPWVLCGESAFNRAEPSTLSEVPLSISETRKTHCPRNSDGLPHLHPVQESAAQSR